MKNKKNKGDSETDKVFNKTNLLKKVDGKTDMAHTILKSFMKNAPLMIEEIKDACNEKDCEYVSIYGHTIMDSSQNASAESMKDIGFDIKIAGKSGNINKIEPLIKKLEIELEKLKIESAGLV